MKFNIKSGNVVIEINVDSNLGTKICKSDFLYNYIPSCELVDKNEITKYKLTIINNKFFKIKKIRNNIYIYKTNNTTVEDIITLIDYYFEYLRQLNNTYCIHGAAIVKNKKGVLLIGGASGIGKTSVALHLIETGGYDFLGDEKILIDYNFKIVGGIKKVNKNKDIQKTPNENLKISYEPVDIKIIVQPVTCENGNLYIEKWDKYKSNFHLYEELSRKIRGISRRVENFETPVESFDNNTISKIRSNFSKNLSQKIECYTIYGDPDIVAKKIEKMLDYY